MFASFSCGALMLCAAHGQPLVNRSKIVSGQSPPPRYSGGALRVIRGARRCKPLSPGVAARGHHLRRPTATRRAAPGLQGPPRCHLPVFCRVVYARNPRRRPPCDLSQGIERRGRACPPGGFCGRLVGQLRAPGPPALVARGLARPVNRGARANLRYVWSLIRPPIVGAHSERNPKRRARACAAYPSGFHGARSSYLGLNNNLGSEQ